MLELELKQMIEKSWDNRDKINTTTTGEITSSVEKTLKMLGNGEIRVAERDDNGDWNVNQWAKKAVLLSFRLRDMELQKGGPQGGT